MVIWHYRKGERAILYLDKAPKPMVEMDFLSRERPCPNALFKMQRQGAIAVMANLPYSEEKTYGLLKKWVMWSRHLTRSRMCSMPTDYTWGPTTGLKGGS